MGCVQGGLLHEYSTRKNNEIHKYWIVLSGVSPSTFLFGCETHESRLRRACRGLLQEAGAEADPQGPPTAEAMDALKTLQEDWGSMQDRLKKVRMHVHMHVCMWVSRQLQFRESKDNAARENLP